jgi:hypothetical protein
LCIFILFVLQPTNAQIHITLCFLYIMFTPTCINTSVSSSGSFKNSYFTKLHQFLELQLLKLKFYKIIRLKLFGRHWVIQYSLCDAAMSWESSVFMWLHKQSLVTVLCVLVWRVTWQDIATSHRLRCITQRWPNNFNLIILWNFSFNSCNSKNWCNLAK